MAGGDQVQGAAVRRAAAVTTVAAVVRTRTGPRGGRRRRAPGAGVYWRSGMGYEVLGAALAVVGALLWIRRDLRADLRHEIGEVRADIRALNGRIDAFLPSRRGEET